MSEDPYRQLVRAGLAPWVEEVSEGPEWTELEEDAAIDRSRGRKPVPGWIAAGIAAVAVLGVFGVTSLIPRADETPTATTNPSVTSTTTLPASNELGLWQRVDDTEGEFSMPGDQVVSGIAGGPAGFVAVGEDERSTSSEDDEAAVWMSPNGTEWSRVASDASFVDSAMADVVWFPEAELFVAVGLHVSDGAVWVSADGGNWERVALLEFTQPPGGIEVDAITVGGPGVVAVGREWLSEGLSIPAVWASSDGRQWNRTGDLAQFGDQAAMVDVVQHGMSVYSIGYVNESEPAIWESTDLANWQLLPVDSLDGESVVFTSIGSDQTALAITGSSSAEDVDARVWTSADGQTWRPRQQPALNVGIPALQDVTITPHGWLAVGMDGTTYRPSTGAAVWMSIDGEVWQRYPTDSGALSPDPAAVAMITAGYGNDVGIAGGVTGETCVERFADCNLDAAFWTWTP
ncbi:MAG: hypothetical protein WAN34_02515 [Acidimicrobiia bacterium]